MKLVKEVRCQSSGEEEYKETKMQALKKAPTVTSSGRKVIPKRFIGEDDDSDGREKVPRKRRRVGSVVKRESSHDVPKVRSIVKMMILMEEKRSQERGEGLAVL